jgi:hypothetical protein
LVVSLLAFGYKLEVVQLCCNLNTQLLGFSCIDPRLLSSLWFCLPFISLFFSPCASLFFWFHRSTLVHFFFTFALLKYVVGSLILATLKMYVKVCSSMLPCAYKLGSSCSCLDQGITIFCMHRNRNFGCRLSYNWLLKVLIRLFYTFLHPLLTADEVSGDKWQLVIARSWFATL